MHAREEHAHRRADPRVKAVVQLARQLRVLALDVEKHQEPVHLLGALWHAVRGGRAVGALDMELLGER